MPRFNIYEMIDRKDILSKCNFVDVSEDTDQLVQ